MKFIKSIPFLKLLFRPYGDDEPTENEFSAPDFSALQATGEVVPGPGNDEPKTEEEEDPKSDDSPDPNDGEGSGVEDEGAADEKPEAEGDEPAAGESDESADEPPADDEPKGDEIDNSDLDEINPSPRARPEIKTGFDALKGKIVEGRKEIKSLETRLAESEAKNKELSSRTPEIPDQVKAELEEMRKFYFAHNIEATPEYKEKFADPINQKTSKLVSDLNRISGGTLPKEISEALAAKGVRAFSSKWWDEQLLPKIPRFERASVEAQLTELLRLNHEADSEKENLTKNAGEFFERQKKQQEEKWQTWGQEARAEGERIGATLGDWIQERKIGANATPEEKKAAEEHNAKLQGTVKTIEEYVGKIAQQDPKMVTRGAIAMVHSEHLKAENSTLKSDKSKLEKEVESLRKELGSVKKAGRMKEPESSGKKKEPVFDGSESASASLDAFFSKK